MQLSDSAIVGNDERGELVLKHEVLKTVLDAADCPIFMIDRDGRYTYVSKAGAAALGLDERDILGKTWKELGMPEEVMRSFETHRQEVITSKAPLTDSFRYPHPHGLIDYLYTISPVFSHGEVKSVVITFTDISTRVKVEKELEDALQVQLDLKNALPSGVLVYRYDGPDSLILQEMNPRAAEMLGVQATEVVGKPFDGLWSETSKAEIEKRLIEVMHTGDNQAITAVRYSNAPGNLVLNLTAFRMPRSRLGVIVEDITMQRQLEDARKVACLQLESNIVSFAALIDQVRNPCFAIIEHARKCPGEGEGIIRQAEKIEDVVKKLDSGWIDSEKVMGFLKKCIG